MSDRLEMNLDEVAELGLNLNRIRDQFEQVRSDTDDAVALTGDVDLARAVREFSVSGQINRDAMKENLTNLQGIVMKVVEEMADVEAAVYLGLAEFGSAGTMTRADSAFSLDD